MKNRVLILATNGVEQVELLATHDVLIRTGIDVDIAFDSEDEYIVTSYNIKIKVDLRMKDIMTRLHDYSAVILPGGPGYEKLGKSQYIDEILKHFHDNKKLIAAICAAPVILAKRGYLNNKHAICYDDKDLRKTLISNGAIIDNPNCKFNEPCEVVIDGNIITGLKMQSTIYFAEKVAEFLKKK